MHINQANYLKDHIKELEIQVARSKMGEGTEREGSVSNMDIVKDNFVKLASQLPVLDAAGEGLV